MTELSCKKLAIYTALVVFAAWKPQVKTWGYVLPPHLRRGRSVLARGVSLVLYFGSRSEHVVMFRFVVFRSRSEHRA